MEFGIWNLEFRAQRRAFTLVEILVVIVILVIGIFALARLFPEGFLSLGATSNRTLASALAKYEEDFERRFRENLPEAIVPLDPRTLSGGFPLYRTGMTPQDLLVALPFTGTLTGYSGAPPDDPRYTDINQAREVIGETVKVPPAIISPTFGIAANANQVSLYHVLFAPIYGDPITSGSAALNANCLPIIAYSGTPCERLVVADVGANLDPDDQARLTAADTDPTTGLHYGFAYGINYPKATLYFEPATYARLFLLRYTFHDQNDVPIQSPRWQQFPLAANATSLVVPLPAGASLDENSDLLVQALSQVPAGTAFSANPFEMKVLDTTSGLIGFNPLLANATPPHQEGRGFIARIDYTVDDWHILRQDETVPAEFIDPNGVAGDGDERHVLKLAVPLIKQIGDVEDPILNLTGAGADTAIFEHQGLVRNYPGRPGTPGSDTPAITDGLDLLIVDQDTGLQIDSRTLQPTGNNSNGEIDYAKGIVHLRLAPTFSAPFAAGNGPVGPLSSGGMHVRVYYRTNADFGVGVYKPYTNYIRHEVAATPADAGEYLHQYYWMSGSSPTTYGYVLFPRMDEEKTVAVDYSWQSLKTGAIHREVGELHQVQPPGTAFAPPAPAPATYSWIRLSHADPASAADPAGDADVNPTSLSITAIRGASISSRVVWRDGNTPKHVQRTSLVTAGK